MLDKIWITWEKQTRNRSISKELGVKLFEFTDNNGRFSDYLKLLRKTAFIIKTYQPKLIFVQNPSLILSLFVSVIGLLTKRYVIVDAHNVGIVFEHQNHSVRKICQYLNYLVIRIAKIIIVSNSSLASIIKNNRGRPFVLPDPFPKYERHNKVGLKGGKKILFVCTYSNDEPYLNLFSAAELLDKDYKIYVTGDHTSKVIPNKIPDNVILTGFLDDKEYINYLHSVDLVIDLTNRENCLVCGAYEGMAAGKPLVLSDKKALRDYFGNTAYYTNNTATDMAEKIKRALDDAKQLEGNVELLKRIRTRQWNEKKLDLNYMIEKLG
jgi:glycosyltransferase involved in cell wall biosynthesis